MASCAPSVLRSSTAGCSAARPAVRPSVRLSARRVPGVAATRRTPTAPRAVIKVNEDNFEEEVLKSDGMVLVDYWATWCGPCKLISPFLDWADQEYPDLKVVKIETDPNPALVEKYKVYGLPTIMLFKDGEVVEDSHQEGAISKKSLVEYLDFHGAKAVV
mmetsp:Transcript_23077/g.40969  ORF Transcript_23077/g.40969 Transcript_23077/m.40969 type:complete len:160 (-) Transcript_23077:213-692(-)